MNRILAAPAIALSLLAAPALAGPAPDRTVPALTAPRPGTTEFAAMQKEYRERVAPIVEAKCFACHSTRAASSRVRKKYDMTGGFPFKGGGTATKRLREFRMMVERDAMPPAGFLEKNPGARLTKAERGILLAWVERRPGPR